MQHLICSIPGSFSSLWLRVMFSHLAGQDKLFRIVYEKSNVKMKTLDPHLWSYRQRVSLEHLGQTLLDETSKEKYPILHEFLKVVSLELKNPVTYCMHAT